MDSDLEIIFRDMEAEGIIKSFRKKSQPKDIKLIRSVKPNVEKIYIGDMSSKFIVKHSNVPHGLLSVASSKLYKKAGIITPQVHLLTTSDKNIANTIQEDVTDINGFDTFIAGEDVEYSKVDKKLFGKFKWQLFYDKGLENLFLQFMTPECFEQLQNMFLADELRTDIDRHNKNYFLYKRKGSDKYEGIIVVDLDQMIICNYCGTDRRDFESFLIFPYESATPQMQIDNVSYGQRVKDIRELIQDGALSDGNIEMLKILLGYDFPKEIRKVC